MYIIYIQMKPRIAPKTKTTLPDIKKVFPMYVYIVTKDDVETIS